MEAEDAAGSWMGPRGTASRNTRDSVHPAETRRRWPRRATAVDHAVEVPGIEPGSFAVLSGLLRAQLTVPLLDPGNHVSKLP